MNPAPPMTSTPRTVRLARARAPSARSAALGQSAGTRASWTLLTDRQSWRRRRPRCDRGRRSRADDAGHDRVLDDAPRRRRSAPGSSTDRRPSHRRRRRAIADRRRCRRPTPSPATTAPGGDRPAPVSAAAPGDEVEVGPQVQFRAARRRSSSRPSPARGSGHAAATQRERVALDRHRPPGGMRVEHLGLEHVGAGVDQVARLGARRRLLDEAHAPARRRRARRRRTPTGRRRRSGGSSPRRSAARCAATRSATSRSVSTSPLATTNVSSIAAVVGGEADRAGRVERLRLDRVVERARRRTGRRGTPRRTARA